MGTVGYVVKRYPRYSETFIVNEILAHERAGLDLAIFALRPSVDTHFQSIVSEVRAPVCYLDTPGRTTEFWSRIAGLSSRFPRMWEELAAGRRMHARDVYQAVNLVERATEAGVTHLHAHFATSAADVARLASRISGIPFTFTAHAKDIFHEDVDTVALEQKLTDADSVVTVSDYNRSYLGRHYGHAASRVRRIYNGLDVNEFRFSLPQKRRRKILGIGRLVEKKGFDVLIRACAVLQRTGSSFECQIVGDGDQKPALEQLIRDLDIGDVVTLAGPRPRTEVIDLVQESAVFAAPCVVGSDGNQDGLPTVLLESMALGTPCVSTDVTGIPEVLRHGETGLMVAQHDANGLADAMARLLENADLSCRLAAKARALIESEFDITRNSAKMRSLFRTNAVDPATAPGLLSLGRVA
ncbi:MAG: glycosyltransferase family 4 protein [Rhodothermales bacterium]|nr:glycosyltransferase family 4 protein [Rhodothermales bacterium]